MRAVLLCFLLAFVPGSAGVAGRQSVAPGRHDALMKWRAAVEAHSPGLLGGADIDVAAWPEDRLATVVADIVELARFLGRAHPRPGRRSRALTVSYDGRALTIEEVRQLLGLSEDEAARGDVSGLANRGALLHTDIATALDGLDPRVRSPSAAGQPGAVLVLDGEEQGVSDRGPHWRVARSLLDLIPASTPAANVRRQWYVATAAYLQSRSSLADLVPHMAKARQVLPADAEILFYSGAMHETMAAPFVQEAARRITLPPGMVLDVTSARTHLRAARTFFRRALDAAPGRAEARVRLGRVLGMLGDHREAAVELERALSVPLTPRLEYYASLFLGGEHVRLGRPDAARKSFARASALYPAAQSPRLGLSTVARAAGRRGEAAEVLMGAVTGQHPGDDSRDPWWTYFAENKEEADRLLAAWRKTIEDGDAP